MLSVTLTIFLTPRFYCNFSRFFSIFWKCKVKIKKSCTVTTELIKKKIHYISYMYSGCIQLIINQLCIVYFIPWKIMKVARVDGELTESRRLKRPRPGPREPDTHHPNMVLEVPTLRFASNPSSLSAIRALESRPWRWSWVWQFEKLRLLTSIV